MRAPSPALAAHRIVFGINTLLVSGHGAAQRHPEASRAWAARCCFFVATGTGSFLANRHHPGGVGRWGRYRTANGALLLAALIQLGAAGLHLPMMVLCGFLLGAAGQVVKLCADTAMQIDVDDALRGHVFTVQDALFWISFVVAMTAAAAVIPADGRSPGLVAGRVGGLSGRAGGARRRRPRAQAAG